MSYQLMRKSKTRHEIKSVNSAGSTIIVIITIITMIEVTFNIGNHCTMYVLTA